MNNQIDNTNHSAHKFIRRLLWGISIVAIFGLILASCNHVLQQKWARERMESDQFLRQIIDSAINNTEFYKEHLEEGKNDDLCNARYLLSNNYNIVFLDYDDCQYQYRVFFDDKVSFWVEILYIDKPRLFCFILEPPRITQKYLEKLKGIIIQDANKSNNETN
ncbi:MAG: hypothetical protein JW806_01730 [Sedimentisphaerales bacterium]|nr:hypothetical protein [Sedimentisphaerales bacterium]